MKKCNHSHGTPAHEEVQSLPWGPRRIKECNHPDPAEDLNAFRPRLERTRSAITPMGPAPDQGGNHPDPVEDLIALAHEEVLSLPCGPAGSRSAITLIWSRAGTHTRMKVQPFHGARVGSRSAITLIRPRTRTLYFSNLFTVHVLHFVFLAR